MKRLYRSRRNRMLCGICGGLGEFFQVDPTIIRLLLFFITMATGFIPLFLTYLLSWIIIPEGP